jgi:hypothetical protein
LVDEVSAGIAGLVGYKGEVGEEGRESECGSDYLLKVVKGGDVGDRRECWDVREGHNNPLGGEG